MKRSWIILVLAAVLLAGCYPVMPAPAPEDTAVPGPAATAEPSTSPDAALVPLTLGLGYIPSVQFAPFYVAQARGHFRSAGLEVTFRHGLETDFLTLVGTGEQQFMVGSGEEVILGRSQGLPVRYVMRWYRSFPVVLFAKASAGIRTPADLAGRRVGVPGLFGASYIGWEAIVYAGKVDAAKVDLRSIGFTQATSVSAGQVDAAMDYVVNGPVQLRLAGEEVTVIPVSDYVDLPSNGIITNEQTIREHPQLVRALVSAALAGLRDTLEDPDAAFEISLEAVPEAGGEQAVVNRAIFDESLKLWQADAAELGRTEPAAWEKAVEFMQAMGLIQTPVMLSDLYTNDFVP